MRDGTGLLMNRDCENPGMLIFLRDLCEIFPADSAIKL